MPEAVAAPPALPGRGACPPRPDRSRARALLPWLLAGALGLAGAALLLGLPADPRLALCPSRALLALPCPGCGMTRALAALLRGDVAGTLRLHPWAPALTVQLALGWAAWGWSLRGRAAPPAAWLGPALLANLAALAALWLGRLATGSLP